MRTAAEDRRRRWFRLHVAGFLAGALTVAFGAGNGWWWALALGGLALAGSGASAIAARRSMLVWQGLRPVVDGARQRQLRTDAERANAWMAGVVLAAVGLLVAVLGAIAWVG